MPSDTAGDAQQRPVPNWKVLLYVPNVIGYARILLSVWALHTFVLAQCESSGPCQQDVTSRFVLHMLAAAFLDMIDGPLARQLKQTSQFGVYVDIIADNIWRTAGWMALAIVQHQVAWLCLVVVGTEWTTFFASQVVSLTKHNASKYQKVITQRAMVVAIGTTAHSSPFLLCHRNIGKISRMQLL